jgi:hypothetical protein
LAVLLLVFGVFGAEAASSKDLLVIEGGYDNIEGILETLGFKERMDVVPDNPGILVGLNFGDYKALFINCDYGKTTDRPDQALLDRVKAFVEGGGMLYVTDDSANFLKSWDTEMDYTISYDSGNFKGGNWKTTVVDAALKAAFPADRFDANGSVIIHHTSDNGEPILDPGRAAVLLKNAADPQNSSAVPGQVQAIDFKPAAGGRVVYTTFHNHHGAPPTESNGDDYIAYQNVLTIMRHICGSLGTAAEQEALLRALGASATDVIGNPQGGPLSSLLSARWTFDVSTTASDQLTFALYAATGSVSARVQSAQADDQAVFTLTAPDGSAQSVYGDPTQAPVVFHAAKQSGQLWSIQCADPGVISDQQVVTGMALAGRFGTASPATANSEGGGGGGGGCSLGFGAGILALAGLALLKRR